MDIKEEGNEKPKKKPQSKKPPPPPTSFSPVTSTNIGICPKNFLTFRYNPFATLV